MSPFEASGAGAFGGSATVAPPPNIPVPPKPANPPPPAVPPRPTFIPPKLDPLKPGGPLPPLGGPASPLGGPPLAGGQDKLRRVIFIIVFIAFLVVIGLIVLLLVGGRQDEQIDKQVSQPPAADTSSTAVYDYNQPPLLAVASDAERVAAVAGVKRALELYYRDYKQDPVVNGITAQDRWANLMGVLVTQGQLYEPVVDLGGAANYDYHARADGKAFVLSATLTDNFNQVLASDIDGLVLGANCDDPVYCVGYVK